MTSDVEHASIANMNKADIEHLANLSRIHLTNTQMDAYAKEFDEIVHFFDKIKEITQTTSEDEIEVHHLKNVLREDTVSSYENTQDIIEEAPAHQDRFVKVKKILNQNES